VKLYVRGKPTVIVVDDAVLLMSKPEQLRFALYDKNFNSYWPMIMEKAFAKVKGNYLNLASGYLSNSVRALTGAPVGSYLTKDTSNSDMWNFIYNAKQSNYIVTVGTAGSSDATTNSCGVTNGHALTVLAAFTLTDSSTNTVVAYLYMIRNPRAYSIYKMAWRHDDPAWTSEMKA